MSRPGEAFRGLHVLVDDDARWGRDPFEQAAAACAGGAQVVQLRVKHAGDGRALEWGLAIAALTRRAGVHFVVNDRFDLALACDADAVHLGQADLPPASLPAAARERLAVGRSTHDVAQARACCSEPVDYVAFGPVYGTTSKPSEYRARGLSMLREIAGIVAPRTLIAIGGIDGSKIPELIRAGAHGVAVISAVAPTATASGRSVNRARVGFSAAPSARTKTRYRNIPYSTNGTVT